MHMLNFKAGQFKSENCKIQVLHSRMVSAAEPDSPDPVSQIHESRRVEDPGMLGFKIAVLAFTSSLVSSLYVLNVRSSAPSRTIAARARL